ncbi:glycosyltransferase [Shewanella benthica]|uniref:glycosyltransferase n=1 Tax=Shewanella benthica TaxID=43661 RepID=UPI001879EAEE|nr:glycosyltransferase [Shewanella benthica]MBE7213942.1 glycosyltransferase [Shewanella benthica]MCL1063831.1 glycosyltransferase [Shewanella benthica]
MNKVLIVAHGHPELNKGGGEQAAYNLFQECLAQGDDAYFLARTDAIPHGGAAFSCLGSEREILFHTTHDDEFLFSNIKTRHLWRDFSDLIKKINPDVIHFHHYFLLGIEMFQVVKQLMPETKITLTLHEYYGICANSGLMLKAKTDKLCYKSGTLACSQCLPTKSPGDLFLRKEYIMQQFDLIDQFISPSQFLKQRYVDWGLSAEKIAVLENGQPEVASLPLKTQGTKVRLTYIGQINRFKGLDVLLDALLLLDRNERADFQLDIHGANFSAQTSDFQKSIATKLKRLGSTVCMHGSYEPHELASILEDTDWVIVPSVWWENSPMVIQESLNYGRPLIVSDIGGMAEKVKHMHNGLQFRAGKASSLMQTLKLIVSEPELRDRCASNIEKPLTIKQAYSQIKSLI